LSSLEDGKRKGSSQPFKGLRKRGKTPKFKGPLRNIPQAPAARRKIGRNAPQIPEFGHLKLMAAGAVKISPGEAR